MRVKEMQKHT
jgi:hypothetical protein